MANDIVSLGEVDEDVAITIAISHLSAIPECVVVFNAVMDRRDERHASVVDRVSTKQLLVKVDDSRRLDEGPLRCRIRRRSGVGYRGTRQRGAVMTIENRDGRRTSRGDSHAARKNRPRSER